MKTAVILFNLGGPDSVESVAPFLFNLFNDPAIIRLPQPFRHMIARLVSDKREKTAQEIYKKIGGHSPILRNTQLQAEALEKALNPAEGGEAAILQYKCFVAMRYWHPFAEDMLEDVRDFAPDNILLLPLYPQYSTTTSASSLLSWRMAAAAENYHKPTRAICCYPQEAGFIRALAALTKAAYDEALKHGEPRILFSAHGLPKKIVRAGDPYPYQCQLTAEALVREMGIKDPDWVLCYQSRVGPLQWIGPSTDDEIRRTGADGKALVVVPVAFVSEHSETMVEIDMEYRHLAERSGVPFFVYTGTVGIAPAFINGLAALVRKHQMDEAGEENRSCPAGTRCCGFRKD